MSNIAVILVDNDSVFAVESLRNAQNGDYLNDATVSVHLRTSAGTDVSGATWPLIVDYVLEIGRAHV